MLYSSKDEVEEMQYHSTGPLLHENSPWSTDSTYSHRRSNIVLRVSDHSNSTSYSNAPSRMLENRYRTAARFETIEQNVFRLRGFQPRLSMMVRGTLGFATGVAYQTIGARRLKLLQRNSLNLPYGNHCHHLQFDQYFVAPESEEKGLLSKASIFEFYLYQHLASLHIPYRMIQGPLSHVLKISTYMLRI